MEYVSGQAIGAARNSDPGADAAGVTIERKCPGLSLTDGTVKDLQGMTSPEILAEVQRTGLSSDPQVGPAAAYLDECVENLKRNVISKQHERVADSAACLVMIVCGAVTALRLGSSMPLTVYLWSFFPALLTVITISSGQQTTRHLGLQGLAVLWGGVALLAAYAAGAYWIVKRH
jgi:lipopolysaccharide export LptBFGC system permease protein LptF